MNAAKLKTLHRLLIGAEGGAEKSIAEAKTEADIWYVSVMISARLRKAIAIVEHERKKIRRKAA